MIIPFTARSRAVKRLESAVWSVKGRHAQESRRSEPQGNLVNNLADWFRGAQRSALGPRGTF